MSELLVSEQHEDKSRENDEYSPAVGEQQDDRLDDVDNENANSNEVPVLKLRGYDDERGNDDDPAIDNSWAERAKVNGKIKTLSPEVEKEADAELRAGDEKLDLLHELAKCLSTIANERNAERIRAAASWISENNSRLLNLEFFTDNSSRSDLLNRIVDNMGKDKDWRIRACTKLISEIQLTKSDFESSSSGLVFNLSDE